MSFLLDFLLFALFIVALFTGVCLYLHGRRMRAAANERDLWELIRATDELLRETDAMLGHTTT